MPDLFRRLGPRAHDRPAPRFGTTLAGAGCALVVVGALTISGDNLGSAGDDGGSNIPGILLSAAVIAAGVLALRAFPKGPLATAGVVASALGIPPFLFFLTYSESDFPPFNIDAVLLVSAVAWTLLYFFGPGKGHAFYLGAALIAVWLFILEQFESVLSYPFLLPGLIFGSSDGLDAPDPTTIGFVSLLFGVGYLAAVRWLDSEDYEGVATAAVVAGVLAIFTGVFALAGDLEETGTGLMLVAVGVGLAVSGGLSGRRFTTWLGGVSVWFGTGLVLGYYFDDDTTALGISLIILGLVVIAIAHIAADRFNERDEFHRVEIDFDAPYQPRAGSSQPAAPPPGPAG